MTNMYRGNIKVFKDGRQIHSSDTPVQAASESDAKEILEAKFRSKHPGCEVTVTNVRRS